MKTSLPANLTEDIKNVIYVFFRAKRKLVEISWSSLLLGSNSAFLKAAQCKQKSPHRIWMKKTAKRAKTKESIDKTLLLLAVSPTGQPKLGMFSPASGQTRHTCPNLVLCEPLPPPPVGHSQCCRDVVKTESKGKRKKKKKGVGSFPRPCPGTALQTRQ